MDKLKYLLKNKFIQKILESFFGKASVTIFSMLFSFVGARLYGAESFGEYSYILAILTLTMIGAKCGMDNGLMYFIPKTGDRYISLGFVLNIISSLVVAIGIFIWTDNILLKTALPAIWLLSSEQIFFGIYRSEGKIKEYFFIQGFLGLASRIIFILIFYKIFGEKSLSMIYALVASLIISNGVLLWKTRKKFKKIIYDSQFIKYSIPMIIGAMMGTLMGKIDIIMLGKMIDKTSVGIYQIASQLAGAISVILMIFNTVFAPKISQLHHEGKKEELKNLYIKSTRLLGLISFFCIGFLCIVSNFALGIFGKEFLHGQWALIFRAIGQFLNAAVGSVWLMLAMTGKPKLQMWGNIAACIINIFLNLLLIPRYGINGAAIASMVAVGFINILGYVLVTRDLNVKVYKFF